MKNDLKEKIMRRRVATCEDDALSSTTTFRASQCGISHYPLPVQNAENSNVSLKKGNKIMTKEETKQRIAVMQAYVDGKQIQVYETSLRKWFDTDAPSWITSKRFRVKHESPYRPFRNAEECWWEMLKHFPFGIMSSKNRKDYMSFMSLNDEGCDFCGYEGENFESAFDDIQFADGTPFGIKED